MIVPFLFSLFLLLLPETLFAECRYKFIHNASELVEFSNEVNSGSTYESYTVYLSADIKFNKVLSQQFRPIGNATHYFLGTFDGQGYVIKNLVVNTSSLQYVGLFGHSNAMHIENVVLDNSCSISSYYTSNSNYAYTAGIIGCCNTIKGPCILENSINMANVSYSSYSSNFLYIGGFVGWINIPANSYETKITNCVNYGTITNFGSCSNSAIFGGIIGEIYTPVESYKSYVYNCLNYGTILNDGTLSKYYLAGITGDTYGTSIINCVSIGKVISLKGGFVGSITGTSWYYDTTYTHCYWTTNTECDKYYGLETGRLVDSGIYLETSINASNTDEINNYAVENKWNKWAYNKNNITITFVVFDGEGFSFDSQLILLPKPVRRGYSFSFWCVNQNLSNGCNKKYNREITPEFTSETILYAQWIPNKCTVTLNVNESNEITDNENVIDIEYGAVYGKSLLTPTRMGYTFTGWFTANGVQVTNESIVSSECNSTLYGYWTFSNFTVTFDVNGGNELDKIEITVTFNSTYGELPSPERSGFTFGGWFTKNNEEITNETIVNITNDLILCAKWEANNYTVSFDENGGEELIEKNITVISDKAHKYLPIPNRRGYTFAGWYTEGNELITNDTETTSTTIITKNQTLRAKWIPNNYTVAFDVNGGDEFVIVDDKEKKVTFDVAYESLPEPSRKGYTFDGWYTIDNELITNVTIVNITSDCTLYANWIANTYKVSFVLNGGEITGYEDGMNVTYNNSYKCLPIPTREGYEFLWWYIEDTKEKVDNETIVEIASNHTLCAVWDKNTVILDVNGGDESGDENMWIMEVKYNEKYDSLPTPVRKGYTFDGWYDKDNKVVTNNTIVNITSNQTLKANWTANTYVITFNVDGGNTLPDNKKEIKVVYDSIYDTLPIPIREGFTFAGWFNENNEEITNETIVNIADNQTLHARWIENVTSSKYVEIVFEKNDLTDEEIRNIIGMFINEDFDIMKIDNNKYGGTTVIIKFSDTEKAEKFVKIINESKNSASSFIRSACLNSWSDISISSMIYPFYYLIL